MSFRRIHISRCFMLGALVSLATCWAATTSLAESFRIETNIFVGEEKEKEKDRAKEEVVSRTTTLFQNGIVYDFLEKPERTAVFRGPHGGNPGRFILLNAKERAQTEVTTERLVGAMTKLRTWAAQQKDPFLQFAANPRFDETFDREEGKLVLASHLQTYTVETTPTDHQDALAEYRQFLDWYTQLNTLLTTANPPDPRLKLNDAMARHKVFPAKIELQRAGEDPIRAEHVFTWRLSQADVQRIDEVQSALAAFRKVENQEFLRLSEPVPKK